MSEDFMDGELYDEGEEIEPTPAQEITAIINARRLARQTSTGGQGLTIEQRLMALEGDMIDIKMRLEALEEQE